MTRAKLWHSLVQAVSFATASKLCQTVCMIPAGREHECTNRVFEDAACVFYVWDGSLKKVKLCSGRRACGDKYRHSHELIFEVQHQISLLEQRQKKVRLV
jgi:hypothetical protein